MGTGAGDDTVTLGTGDDNFDARLTTTSTEKVVVTDFEDAGVTVGDTVILSIVNNKRCNWYTNYRKCDCYTYCC